MDTKMSISDLEKFKDELKELVVKLSKHRSKRLVADQWVIPLSDNRLVFSLKKVLFNTDTGRESIYAMRRVRTTFRLCLAGVFILRVNAWMEYIVQSSGLNTKDYATMVNMLFLLLFLVDIVDIRCLKWEMSNWGSQDPDQLYEDPEQRERKLNRPYGVSTDDNILS